MAPRIVPSAATEVNRYMSFTVLEIFMIIVSVINSLGRAVHSLLKKRSSIPSWQKYICDIALFSVAKVKVTKLAKEFDIPTTMLTTVSKIKTK